MTLPDAVYVCRPGENEELRYSLRTLAMNAEGLYRKVWIVGTVLPWLRNVEPLPLPPIDDKFANQRQSLTAIVNHPDLTEEWVLLNDDHFIVGPITEWRTYHLGTAFVFLAQLLLEDGEKCNNNEWAHAVLNTALWVQQKAGIAEPYAYECHTPLLFSKTRVAQVLEEYPPDGFFAIGETYPLTGAGGEGEVGPNVKLGFVENRQVMDVLDFGVPYMSSEDDSFNGPLGEWLREKFPEPSPYEEAS